MTSKDLCLKKDYEICNIFEFSILKKCKMLEGRSQMCNKAKKKNVIRIYGRERIDSAVRGKRGFS